MEYVENPDPSIVLAVRSWQPSGASELTDPLSELGPGVAAEDEEEQSNALDREKVGCYQDNQLSYRD